MIFILTSGLDIAIIIVQTIMKRAEMTIGAIVMTTSCIEKQELEKHME